MSIRDDIKQAFDEALKESLDAEQFMIRVQNILKENEDNIKYYPREVNIIRTIAVVGLFILVIFTFSCIVYTCYH